GAAIAAALRRTPVAHPAARVAQARQPAEVRGRPAPPEPRPPEPRAPEPRVPEPHPAEPVPAAIDVSANAIERLRTAMVRPDRVVTTGEDVPLSPNGGYQPTAPALKPEPPVRPAAAAGEAASREPRLDCLCRPKAPRPTPAHQADACDAMWPKRPPRPAPDGARTDEVARQPGPPSAGEERRAPAPGPTSPEEPRSVAILKSGVVDGMAY